MHANKKRQHRKRRRSKPQQERTEQLKKQQQQQKPIETSSVCGNNINNVATKSTESTVVVDRPHHPEITHIIKQEKPCCQTAPSTTTTWASVFQQAASIEQLGGDLDHDETFRPPAPEVHPGLSQIAQLLQTSPSPSSTATKPPQSESSATTTNTANSIKRKKPQQDSALTSTTTATTSITSKKKKKKSKKRKSADLCSSSSDQDRQQQSSPGNGDKKRRIKVEENYYDEDHGDVETMNSITGDERPQKKQSSDSIVTEPPQFPFDTDPDDHCETPLQAYHDILPFLQFLQQHRQNPTATKPQTPSSSLRIYDPYYCNGAVVRNLSALGFDQVYNVKEDCYQVWESNACPDFDVLVTNPPYSGDHIERLWRQLTTSASFRNRPWLLLLPNWVHKKDYYKQVTRQDDGVCRPFYLVPQKRYVYEPPRHFRQPKKSDVHVKSSPFFSMWYIWGGTKEMTEAWIQHYLSWQRQQQHENISCCTLVRTPSALRDLRRKKR